MPKIIKNGIEYAGTSHAENVSYDNSTSGLSATDVQSAVDELSQEKTPLFRYGSTTSGDKIKININAEISYMLCFVVTIYRGYEASKIMISGYNYGTNHWHEPKAVLLGDSSAVTRNVYFGYDGNYKLWVGFDAGNYTGISISDVTNGYTQIEDFSDLFTITRVTSLSTLQTTISATLSVNYANSAGSVAWSNITNIPTKLSTDLGSVPIISSKNNQRTFTSSTTKSYTGLSLTCPAGHRYFVRLYFRYVYSRPIGGWVSFNSSVTGTGNTEVIASLPVNGESGYVESSGVTFILTAGETVYYWAQYQSAANNRIDEFIIDMSF